MAFLLCYWRSSQKQVWCSQDAGLVVRQRPDTQTRIGPRYVPRASGLDAKSPRAWLALIEPAQRDEAGQEVWRGSYGKILKGKAFRSSSRAEDPSGIESFLCRLN